MKLLLVLLVALFAGTAAPAPAAAAESVPMYRLYNRWTGEHFYTSSSIECSDLAWIGWDYEGIGWYAPVLGEPVHRLYNPYVQGGDHHYTMSDRERDELVKVGWRAEGVGWYSGGTVEVYRQYNPYAITGTHNYTTSKGENEALVKLGWRAEGIGWNAVDSGSPNTSGVPTKHQSYTISFESEGGSEVKDQLILFGNMATKPADPTREGYTFLGWTTDSWGENPYNFDRLVTDSVILHAQWQKNLEYHYEVYYLDGFGSTWYSETSRFLYVKTDNPTDSFTLRDEQASNALNFGIDSGRVYDVVDQGSTSKRGYLRVPGGYLVRYSFETDALGAHTIEVVEDAERPLDRGAVGETLSVTFASYEDAKDAWIGEQIKKYTTSDMTPPEKMHAICSGLLREFDYPHINYEQDRVYILTEPTAPFFLTNHWDSATSPAVLCDIAERIGGFSSINNCYDDYPLGSEEWSYNHYYCECVYQGKTYRFEACPAAGTGLVDPAEVEKIDFGRLGDAPFARA